MDGVWWAFQECGWPSWLGSLAAIGGLAFSGLVVVMAVFRSRPAVLLGWLALAVAVLPVGIGAAGMAIGRARVDRLIAGGFVDPSQLSRIREEGYREAGGCVNVGLALTALPLLVAASGLVAAYAFRARPRVATE